MKLFRKVIWGGITLAAALCFVHAQSGPPPTISAEDTATMIQAIEEVAPTPGSSLPPVGTFWSAQHAPGTASAWPPLPGNILGLDAWPLGDGQFLLNDTNVDYAAIQAAADAAAAMAHPWCG